MNETRRNLLFALGSGAIAVSGSLIGIAAAAEIPKLDPKSAAASALSYSHKSNNSTKVCAGCQFFTNAGAEWGPCLIFPGTRVSAKGICNSWFERAS